MNEEVTVGYDDSPNYRKLKEQGLSSEAVIKIMRVIRKYHTGRYKVNTCMNKFWYILPINWRVIAEERCSFTFFTFTCSDTWINTRFCTHVSSSPEKSLKESTATMLLG